VLPAPLSLSAIEASVDTGANQRQNDVDGDHIPAPANKWISGSIYVYWPSLTD